jgi:hypothetical protein
MHYVGRVEIWVDGAKRHTIVHPDRFTPGPEELALDWDTVETYRAPSASPPGRLIKIVDRRAGGKSSSWTFRTGSLGGQRAVTKVTRRDPASSGARQVSGKPLVMKKVGSKWELWLDVAAAHRYSRKAEKRLKEYPVDALVPLVKSGAKQVGLVVGGKPAKMTKDEALGIAHQIGRYMLDLGDFTYTYVEEDR